MKRIEPIPHDDEDMIAEICEERAGWSAHKATWIQSVVAYKDAKGNPWSVKRAAFSTDISSELKTLYTNRRSSGHIKRIRDYPVAGSCPLCGSLGTGSVDHFLPKDKFPEFSIYSLNLIPACHYCNSSEKGSTYIGDKAPARLVHPYFDKIGDQPVLSVAFSQPYNAVKFSAVPVPGLSGDELEIVRFHMKELLGDAFNKYVDNLWATLPQIVADLLEGLVTKVTLADVRKQVQWLLKSNQSAYGLNSWPAGFYRGVLADPAVLDYVAQNATEILAQKGPT